MPIAAIASPLSNPPSAPMPKQGGDAEGDRRPPRRRRAGRAPRLRITRTASIEDRLARPITDRSMPPVSIDTMTPSASSANSGNWNAIDERLARVRNRSGSAALMPTNTRAVINASRPRLSLSSRRANRRRRSGRVRRVRSSYRTLNLRAGGEARAQRRHAGAEQDQGCRSRRFATWSGCRARSSCC